MLKKKIISNLQSEGGIEMKNSADCDIGVVHVKLKMHPDLP